MIKTPQQIEEEIYRTIKDNDHLLTGSVATVQINAPRAVMQVNVMAKLDALHWVLGRKFKSKLKGIDT